MEELRYGSDRSQFAELSRTAAATSLGVVVVIHGGFWRDGFDLSLGRPLARSLVEEGWDVLNLEYRRVGGGGGFPQTFDDVADGIDLLAETDLATDRVITLGHSAGGHLAVWAAALGTLQDSPWGTPRVPVTAAVSQAGVLDLAGAADVNLGGGAAQALMGGPPDASWRLADPAQQVPLPVPVRCVHAADDQVVPIGQSAAYVDRARAAGADAELVEVPGDHFSVIDTASEAWRSTLTVLRDL